GGLGAESGGEHVGARSQVKGQLNQGKEGAFGSKGIRASNHALNGARDERMAVLEAEVTLFTSLCRSVSTSGAVGAAGVDGSRIARTVGCSEVARFTPRRLRHIVSAVRIDLATGGAGH